VAIPAMIVELPLASGNVSSSAMVVYLDSIFTDRARDRRMALPTVVINIVRITFRYEPPGNVRYICPSCSFHFLSYLFSPLVIPNPPVDGL